MFTFTLTGLSAEAPSKNNSADILQARTRFEAQIAQVSAKADADLSALKTTYPRSLATLIKSFQDQGDLEKLLIVKKEAERFQAESTVTPANFATNVPSLQVMQSNYVKRAQQVPLRKATDIVKLADECKKNLNALKETLTKAGNIDAALESKAECDGIDNRPEVSAARFALLEADAINPPLAPKVDPPKPAATNTGTLTKKPVTKKKYTGKTENYLRQRFGDFCDLLIRQDMSGALKFVNPIYVKETGEERVISQMRWVLPFIRMTEAPGVKLSSGEIQVDDKEESATVVPRVWANNSWHETPATHWIQVDEDWYLDLHEVQDGGNRQFAPGERPRPRHRRP